MNVYHYIRASSATKDLEDSKVCCEGCALGMRGWLSLNPIFQASP